MSNLFSPDDMPPPQLTDCPFCLETDFDLVGLKLHFTLGHCEIFNAVVLPSQSKGQDANE